ncbi:MAG: DUF4421 domain-containing protein [Sphingobacteriaceae bacterium]|nr:MAG: DUF4421 domain-containing protein [Sphingobacteriaceae bacterium]
MQMHNYYICYIQPCQMPLTLKNYYRKFFIHTLLVICCIDTGEVFAQDTTEIKPVANSGYIEKFDDWIGIKLALVNTSDVLAVEGDDFKQVIQPNPSALFRTYINYRFISFSVSYVPHFLRDNNDDTQKGKSKLFGLGAEMNTNNWLTILGFSRTKGYYLENTKDFRPGWQPGDPYFQIPDLYVTSYNASFGYNTDPKLSVTAGELQTERQLRSAGAFIPRIFLRYYIIDNRTPNAASAQKSTHTQGLFAAGYQYTLVLNRSFYLTSSFTPAFGYIFSKVKTRFAGEQLTDYSKGPVFQWDGKLGLGYNGHRVFAGTYLTAISSKYSQGLTTAVSQDAQLFFQLFVGLRLKAPKALNKAYDNVFK